MNLLESESDNETVKFLRDHMDKFLEKNKDNPLKYDVAFMGASAALMRLMVTGYYILKAGKGTTVEQYREGIIKAFGESNFIKEGLKDE